MKLKFQMLATVFIALTWGTQFEPAKKHFRSDNVDSQRGEAEWRGGNLYFDQFDYDFEWNLVPTTPPEGV